MSSRPDPASDANGANVASASNAGDANVSGASNLSGASNVAGAFNVALARARAIKRVANGTANNLQALAKIGAVEVGDAALQAELTELAQALTELGQRLEAARGRSMAIAAAAAERLAGRLVPGVAYTLARQGTIESRST